jgi:2,4-dienoyl-CoA reductase-like NADH-dependent reductase (Old Yellow Enzyme family)
MVAEVAYPKLFTPLTIRNLDLVNRIVSSGHDTVMVENGLVTDQLVAYHQARAAGGVGLIVLQVSGVHETARYTSHVLMATDDRAIEGYRNIAEAVHPHGTKLFGQLFHPGREVMDHTAEGTLQVAVAPSAVPNERFHVMPRALAEGEIVDIIDGYGAAARRLRAAGLDGVEIVASHGYLPSQFLNPATNLRTDRFGGSDERRLHFLWEVLRTVRAATDDEIVIGMRISIDEHDPFGLDATTALSATTALCAAGLLDYVSVTTGTSATLGGSDHIAPDMSSENGYVAHLARLLKDRIKVPVIVAGRINQPQEAERILDFGDADACVMTRALICDPTLPRLAEEGRSEEIRACIGCNQACIGHFHGGFPISCIQHPETGREQRYGVVIKARLAKDLVVVGAGPAGMKAASIAAQRGHKVSLYEQSSRAGGQILLAERLVGREEFGGAASNLLREVTEAGVAVHFGIAATASLIADLKPDLVIVATGARPFDPPIERMGSPVIVHAADVLEGVLLPKGHIVVFDWGSDWVGPGVARLLAQRGQSVTLAGNSYSPASTLQQYVRDSQLRALVQERINLLPLVRLFGVDDDTVYLQHVLTNQPVLIEGVAAVVLAHARESVNELAGELQQRDIPRVVIGDALAPRTVEEAVLEGLVCASDI